PGHRNHSIISGERSPAMRHTESIYRQGQRTRQGETLAGSASAWLALGTAVAVLLALLTPELVPPIHAPGTFPSSAALASDQWRGPREEEPLGLVPLTFDEFWAHL